MTSPQDFMLAFAKAIIHNVDTRPQIVQQWTEKLDAREVEIGQLFYKRFEEEYDPENHDPYEAKDALAAAKRATGLK